MKNTSYIDTVMGILFLSISIRVSSSCPFIILQRYCSTRPEGDSRVQELGKFLRESLTENLIKKKPEFLLYKITIGTEGKIYILNKFYIRFLENILQKNEHIGSLTWS